MLVTNLPHQYNYTTWDEVFQSENGQQVGWARETVSLTGTAGICDQWLYERFCEDADLSAFFRVFRCTGLLFDTLCQ